MGDLDHILVRRMQKEDLPEVLSMMRELASFEGKTSFQTTDADLDRWTSEELYQFGIFVAIEAKPAGGGQPSIVGYAAYYFLPFRDDGRPAMILKGLFVKSGRRRQGAGRRLFTHVAELAKSKECGNMQWFVLQANSVAKRFYSFCGAGPDVAWARWQLALGAPPDIKGSHQKDCPDP